VLKLNIVCIYVAYYTKLPAHDQSSGACRRLVRTTQKLKQALVNILRYRRTVVTPFVQVMMGKASKYSYPQGDIPTRWRLERFTSPPIQHDYFPHFRHLNFDGIHPPSSTPSQVTRMPLMRWVRVSEPVGGPRYHFRRSIAAVVGKAAGKQ